MDLYIMLKKKIILTLVKMTRKTLFRTTVMNVNPIAIEKKDRAQL